MKMNEEFQMDGGMEEKRFFIQYFSIEGWRRNGFSFNISNSFIGQNEEHKMSNPDFIVCQYYHKIRPPTKKIKELPAAILYDHP